MIGTNVPFNDLSYLKERIAADDDRAFDELFRQLFPSLTFLAFQYTSSEFIAEDIVQDAFLKLWQRRKKLDNVANIKSYLYTIVRNRCYDWLNENAKRKTVPFTNQIIDFPDDQQVDYHIILAETMSEIHRVINSLAPRMQEVFKRYYIEEESTKEIGNIMQTSPKTVSNQREMAMKIIRERIIPDWKARFGK